MFPKENVWDMVKSAQYLHSMTCMAQVMCNCTGPKGQVSIDSGWVVTEDLLVLPTMYFGVFLSQRALESCDSSKLCDFYCPFMN